MNKLTWIHLSDLHFGKNEVDSYEQNHIINELAKDITEQRKKHNLYIDYIFFTGDIVFSGNNESFNKANEYLRLLAQSACIDMSNIIVVPGNHDITRDSLTNKSPALNNKAVSELIGNKAELKQYTSALHNFREFTKQICGFDRYANNELYYVVNQKINGKAVSIMALNTAWLAGKDIKQGEAVLGERQVREALQVVDDADIVIALMHHPFPWLSEDDNNTARGLLEKRTDFILNGHIHRISDIGKLSLFGNAFNISSGSIYGDNFNFSNAYNIVQCDFDEGVGTIFFRQYINMRDGYWSVDNSVDSSIQNGIATFKLPTRIPINNSKAQENITPTLQTQVKELNEISQQSLPPLPKLLSNEIQLGNCVLFAGAGTSVDAGLPMWNELLRNMIDELDNRVILEDDIKNELFALLKEGRNLIVAEYCRTRLGEQLFGEFIHNSLKTKNRRSVIHEILSEIPFSAVLTTNYDSFLEKYRRDARVILPKELSELGYQGIKRIAEDSIPIVKLHGSFDNPNSIIFSDTDYRKALYSSTEYRRAVSQLIEDKSCLFIGFSLIDNNILAFLQSILEKSNSFARKHYIISFRAGKVIQYYNEKCLNVETININSYAQLDPLLRKLKEKVANK